MQNKIMSSEKLQTTINIVTGIIVMVANLGISFFVSPYIVSTLGEEANGFTQLANNFVTYASLITIAFNSMAGRFISIHYHRGERDKAMQYYSSVFLCNILLTALFIPISICIITNLQNLIRIEKANLIDVKILFACVFATFIISLLSSVFSISMYVKNALFIQNGISLVKSILNVVLIGVLYIVFPPKIYYVSVVGVVLTVFVIACSFGVHKHLMPEFKFCFRNFKWLAVRDLLSAGIWNTINQCGNLLMTGLDLLVTNLFISPGAMGTLAIAKTVPNAITNLAITLNTNLAPSLTINWAKGNKEEMLRTLRSSMKISSVLVSIPYMVFCAFGQSFYTLWMPSLDAELLTLLSFLSCMALIPWSGPQVLNNIFSVTNRLKVNTGTFLIAGMFNIIMVFLLLKYTDLGILAVAGVSSVITIIRCFVVTAPYIAHLLEVKWYTFYKDAGLSVLCCVVSYGIARGVRFIIPGKSWASLGVAVIMSAILAFVSELRIILNKRERDFLIAKMRFLKQ